MKMRIVGALAAVLLASCAAPTEQTEQTRGTIELLPLPVQAVPDTTVAPPPVIAVATATETAVRITEAPTTTAVIDPLGLNYGSMDFPFEVKVRDRPHWDCSMFDGLLVQYGMTPIDKAHRIMLRESGCIPGVWNWHVTGPNYNDESFGLFQINMYGKLGPDRQRLCGLSDPIDGVYYDLFWPAINIACAAELKALAGWSPWGG